MKASDLALFLHKDLQGKDIPIHGFSTLEDPQTYSVLFAKQLSPDLLPVLNRPQQDCLVIAVPEFFRKTHLQPHPLGTSPAGFHKGA